MIEVLIENVVGPANFEEVAEPVYLHRHWCDVCMESWRHASPCDIIEEAHFYIGEDWPCPEHVEGVS